MDVDMEVGVIVVVDVYMIVIVVVPCVQVQGERVGTWVIGMLGYTR